MTKNTGRRGRGRPLGSKDTCKRKSYTRAGTKTSVAKGCCGGGGAAGTGCPTTEPGSITRILSLDIEGGIGKLQAMSTKDKQRMNSFMLESAAMTAYYTLQSPASLTTPTQLGLSQDFARLFFKGISNELPDPQVKLEVESGREPAVDPQGTPTTTSATSGTGSDGPGTAGVGQPHTGLTQTEFTTNDGQGGKPQALGVQARKTVSACLQAGKRAAGMSRGAISRAMAGFGVDEIIPSVTDKLPGHSFGIVHNNATIANLLNLAAHGGVKGKQVIRTAIESGLKKLMPYHRIYGGWRVTPDEAAGASIRTQRYTGSFGYRVCTALVDSGLSCKEYKKAAYDILQGVAYGVIDPTTYPISSIGAIPAAARKTIAKAVVPARTPDTVVAIENSAPQGTPQTVNATPTGGGQHEGGCAYCGMDHPGTACEAMRRAAAEEAQAFGRDFEGVAGDVGVMLGRFREVFGSRGEIEPRR